MENSTQNVFEMLLDVPPAAAELETALEEIQVPEGIVVPEKTLKRKPQEDFGFVSDFLSADKQIDMKQCPVETAAEYYKANPGKPSKIDLSGLSLILILDIIAFILYLYETYVTIRTLGLDYIHQFIIKKLKYLIDFARGKDEINSLYHLHEQYPWTTPTNMNCLRFALRSYLVDRGVYPKCSLDDDVWVIDDMYTIAEDRRSATERLVSIRFDRIRNRKSVDLIKMYINYLVVGTTLSIEGNIIQRLHALTEYANSLGENSVLEATHDDITAYIASLKDGKGNSKPVKVSQVRDFYDFLVFKKILDTAPIKAGDLLKQKDVGFNNRTVPETVILQIFDKLPSLPHWAMVVFLCLCCTGMRVAEALSLKKDCLEKKIKINSEAGENEIEYCLRWYVTKTKTRPIHPIPEELGKILEKYLGEIKYSPSEYLFPSQLQVTKPIGKKKFSDTMQSFMDENDIRMPNGEVYHFRAHDWRHTFATKLDEYGVTIYYIAKALNHRNTEMTIRYTDNKEENARKKIRNFFDNNGALVPLKSVPNITNEESVKEWMSKHVNARLVQDGFCDRSSRLGKCSRSDGEPCVTCEWYRTSTADLDAHKARIDMLYIARESAVENGYDMSVAKIDRELGIREKIVESLEKELSNDQQDVNKQ